jgi:hypothetical protein
VIQAQDGIFISQKKYAENLIEKSEMKGCKVVSTPLVSNEKFIRDNGSGKVDSSKYRSLVGSLLYLTATRPDVMFSASLLSRYMDHPTQQHLIAAKRVLRYIQGTLGYGIFYKPIKTSTLIGYTDSDWAGCQDDMKSTSGYVFSLGSGVCSWSTKKQSIVALSSAEAEYVAAARAVSQAIWLKRILEDIYTNVEEPIILYSDSKATIAISENPISHDRTKHIAIKYHYTRDAVDRKEIQLKYCCSEEQKADIFTKVLTREKFERNRKSIGVAEYSLHS